MKCIKHSGKGHVSTMVGGNLVKIMPGDNHLDDKLADGFMKNIKGTKFEDCCSLSGVKKADIPAPKKNEADKVVAKVAKKKASKKAAKKATKKVTKKKAKKKTKKKA